MANGPAGCMAAAGAARRIEFLPAPTHRTPPTRAIAGCCGYQIGCSQFLATTVVVLRPVDRRT